MMVLVTEAAAQVTSRPGYLMGKAARRSTDKPGSIDWDGSGSNPAKPVEELAGQYVEYLLDSDLRLPVNGDGERETVCVRHPCLQACHT